MEKTTKSQIFHDSQKYSFRKWIFKFKSLLASALGWRMESLQTSEMIPERKLLLFYVLIAFTISPLDSMQTTSLQLRNRLEPSPGLLKIQVESPKQWKPWIIYFSGQRCAGRNFNGKRCCTPQAPCGYGEGDCDGPGDGGGNDGHAGCRGELVCGSNNCRKFGLFYHDKDDCCDLPDTLRSVTTAPVQLNGAPLEPRIGSYVYIDSSWYLKNNFE